MLAFLALASLLVGLIIGATGIGGVILIPLLMAAGGLTTHQAMATALASFLFCGIASTWAFQRHGSFLWRETAPVIAGCLCTSHVGAYIATMASARFLDLTLAAIILLSSAYNLVTPQGFNLPTRLGRRGNLALLFGAGCLTGFLCGMTGAGGGIVSTPLLFLCGYQTLPVIATAQILQIFVSLAGSPVNLAHGYIDLHLAGWVSIFEVAGVLLGSGLAHRLPVRTLRVTAVTLCLLTSAALAVKAVFWG
ncbi:MAG: sulfite exporter TauE/SafE family protein [Desulfovibrio sp.]|jgi:uncharacterized membrane protein YfcA|nr:sulfite exporter TauE/SafE family protein [Desulfovibrio sp.]